MPIRSRSFCFTWNNYPAEAPDTLGTLGADYQVYGKEVAPTTGTLHLQGYLHFPNAVSVVSLRRKLPGVHIVQARGSAQQNKVCCY